MRIAIEKIVHKGEECIKPAFYYIRLLESVTDLRYIQALLGHESSKTTERYTHVTIQGFSGIKNPLNSLDL